MISARDFVDLASWEKKDDGTIVQAGTGIEWDEMPPKKGFVRGCNHPSGVVCVPLGEKEMKLIYVVKPHPSRFRYMLVRFVEAK